MVNEFQKAESLLAVDVGEITTRAMLFDVAAGTYRFLATGTARSTGTAPQGDFMLGVRAAVNELESISGRKLLNNEGRVILPAKLDGSGVDHFTATLSAGEPLRVLVMGLLEDVSIESACRLASTTYAEVIDAITLKDIRRPEQAVDLILGMRPDVVMIAGGMEGGAKRAVSRLLEVVGLACQIYPFPNEPKILYTGNRQLSEAVKAVASGDKNGKSGAQVFVAPNIRPALDEERLDAAQNELAAVFRAVRNHQAPGLEQLDRWAGGQLLPTASAFGRVVRFLSKVYDPNKGVFGVDVGAASVATAAAFGGDLHLRVHTGVGVGQGTKGLLERQALDEILSWLPAEIEESYLLDYLYNKMIHPQTLPNTVEDRAVEQAVARVAMRFAVKRMNSELPKRYSNHGLMPWFEPILATGSVLTQSGNYGQTALMLLDALQPVGVTTLVLDAYHLAAALGAAAALNPTMVVQVIESGTFINLGTVIAPLTQAKAGTPVLRVKVTREDGEESTMDIKQGSLDIIPLGVGSNLKLHLQPLHRADIGMGGPGRGGSIRVTGGALGVIIDARGRPLRLPEDAGRRSEMLKKWAWMMGG